MQSNRRKGIAEDAQERIVVLRIMMLMALNVTHRNNMYQGTVTQKVKAKRRALTLRQKASRKANRT